MSSRLEQRSDRRLSRRDFFTSAVILGAGGLLLSRTRAQTAPSRHDGKALIAITLDLEMSRNFPNWQDTHWDYEKGNLDTPTKEYCVEAGRRVKAAGGVVHFFAVGRVFEQENVDWLAGLVRDGHPVGNHTYDHVNLLAQRPDELQFRFKRAPWLLRDRAVSEVIRENISLTTEALKARLGIEPAGFRTPGGFPRGLSDRPDLQQMLRELGFTWVSGKVPRVNLGPPGAEPTFAVLDAIARSQPEAQPFVYPSGLVEIPMSPISDVAAFRSARWKLDHFLAAIRVGVNWAIEHRGVYDFLSHPSVLCPMDPGFRAIDLICELVHAAGDRAALVDLGTIAKRTLGMGSAGG